MKVSSPDYTNMNAEAVLNDFLLRIEHYKEKYEPLDEKLEADLSFMKIYNTGWYNMLPLVVCSIFKTYNFSP